MFYRTKPKDESYELEFFMPDGGGFIRANVGPGRDMVQICRGGGTMGETLSARTAEELKAKAQAWLRQRRTWK